MEFSLYKMKIAIDNEYNKAFCNYLIFSATLGTSSGLNQLEIGMEGCLY